MDPFVLRISFLSISSFCLLAPLPPINFAPLSATAVVAAGIILIGFALTPYHLFQEPLKCECARNSISIFYVLASQDRPTSHQFVCRKSASRQRNEQVFSLSDDSPEQTVYEWSPILKPHCTSWFVSLTDCLSPLISQPAIFWCPLFRNLISAAVTKAMQSSLNQQATAYGLMGGQPGMNRATRHCLDCMRQWQRSIDIAIDCDRNQQHYFWTDHWADDRCLIQLTYDLRATVCDR